MKDLPKMPGYPHDSLKADAADTRSLGRRTVGSGC